MEDNYKDDYNKVLPIYTYGDQKDAKTATPAMEKVFKKASFVIQRHSMSIKGKEYCSWIDDTYLLIGQSHFYKHEYFAGVEVFEYVISECGIQQGSPLGSILFALAFHPLLMKIADLYPNI